MTEYSPTDLAAQLKSGLLSFPVTHFTDDLQFDEEGYRKHLAWLAEYPGRRPVRRRRHRRGLLAHLRGDRPRRPRRRRRGRGHRPGARPRDRRHRPTPSPRPRPPRPPAPTACCSCRPYLTEAGQAGLVEHVSQVCQATGLGVVVYSRANAVLNDEAVATLADRNPTLIGFKDGVGNIEQMTRTYARVGDRLIYIGGLPTAETFALPLLQLGVSTYSSALFNFVPQLGDRLLRRRARPGPRRGLPSTQRVRHPLPRHPRPHGRATPSPSSRAAWPPSAAPPARSGRR